MIVMLIHLLLLSIFFLNDTHLQYLESRFDRRLRMFGSVMFAIMNVSKFIGILLYLAKQIHYIRTFSVVTDWLSANCYLCAGIGLQSGYRGGSAHYNAYSLCYMCVLHKFGK